MRVFDVPIEGESLARTVERLSAADRHQPFWIVTANPEILVEAHRDSIYADVLRQADVRLVDGFGLWLMLRLFGARVFRVTGVEMAERLLRLANERQWKVGLIGGGEGVAVQAVSKLRARFSAIQFVSEEGGYVARDGTDDEVGEEARHRLTLFAPEIVLVAFGHPKQERWIARHRDDFPTAKAVIGVGGTFDYWAETISRAPRLFRQLGLEWWWRLMIQPSRLARIGRAVIIFPILILKERLAYLLQIHGSPRK